VWILTAALLVAVLGATSCSSEQHLSLNGDGSGRGRLQIDIHPMFVQYLKDVSAGFIEGDMEDRQFSAFDVDEIEQTMEELEGISFVSALTEGEGGLDLSFVFSDPEAVLAAQSLQELRSGDGRGKSGARPNADSGAGTETGGSAEPLVDFSSDGALRRLTVRVTSHNFSRLFPLVGVREQETLMTFGPQQDPYSEQEYVEMMEYALGDYEDAETIRKVLRRREARIRVEVDGEITGLRGFSDVPEAEGRGRVAEAVIPFLRAATLREPLVYSITWRPE
jgi:hypothetical protein